MYFSDVDLESVVNPQIKKRFWWK